MKQYKDSCEFVVGHLTDTLLISRAIEQAIDTKGGWLLAEPYDEITLLDLFEATRQYHLDNHLVHMSLDRISGAPVITFYFSEHVRLQFIFYPPGREKYAVRCELLKSVDTAPRDLKVGSNVLYLTIFLTFKTLQLPKYENR